MDNQAIGRGEGQVQGDGGRSQATVTAALSLFISAAGPDPFATYANDLSPGRTDRSVCQGDHEWGGGVPSPVP